MANDDNLDLEFSITGDGERAIERIKGKLRDLGNTAEYSSRQQVDGAKSAVSQYQEEAAVLERVAQSEAKVARAAAQARQASNRIASSNASTTASVANSGASMTVGAARANKAIYSEIEAEQRAINTAQEQGNRNLLNAGRLLTEEEKTLGLIQSREIAASREKDRQADRQAALSRRELADSDAQQAAAEKQGALYTDYLERQEAGIQRKRAAEERASEQELANTQRIAAAQAAADQAAVRRLTDRSGRERTAALAAERNSAALASPGLGSERKSSLTSEKLFNAQDVEQTNALRYALYDTAQTATLAGTAIAAVGASAVVAAAQGEQGFADLSAKFSDADGDLSGLNQSLLQLSTQSPANLGEVLGVAELGAQMNIAKDDLDDFTRVVTQFSATTNVTSEDAAESFGRISQLLDVPSSDFDKLSSSIFQVGVDSVATESQILKTSEEIAGSANAYNFTADSVIGLSSAFASLAIQPEQARGATTRLFNGIETAVQSGGAKLDNYARILGTTSDQAAKLWKQDPSGFFEKLVHGLSESSDRLADIRSIGATGVYDTNVLNRLASNADFLTQSLDTARDAYDKGTAASDAYAKTTDTTIAKLKELGNSLVALGINAGGTLLEALRPIIEIVTGIVKSFANLPAPVLGVLAAVTLLAGGVVLFYGGLATAIAAVIGLRFVLSQLSVAGAASGLSLRTLRIEAGLLAGQLGLGTGASTRLTGALAGTSIGARVAAGSMSVLGFAMKALPWVLVAIGAAQAAQALYDNNKAAIAAASGYGIVAASGKNAKLSTDQISKSFAGARAELDKLNAGNWTSNVASFLGDVFNVKDFTKQSKDEISAIDDRLVKMVQDGHGDQAAKQVRALGLTGEEVQKYLGSYADAALAASYGTKKLGDSTQTADEQLTSYDDAVKSAKDSTDQLFGSLNQQSDFGASIQQLFSGIYDAGDAFSYLSEAGRTNLSNLQDAIAQTMAYGQSIGLDTSQSVALLFYTLQQQGVDTSQLLALMASQPYVFSADLDISQVQAKLAQLTGGSGTVSQSLNTAGTATNGLSQMMSKLAVSAPKAKNGLSGVGKQAKSAAKEVRTLNDYASDLKGVFDDATQYRFGVSDALDEISSQWGDINNDIREHQKAVAEDRKNNAEALKQYKSDIKDTRLEIQGIRSDLAGLQAQLSQKKYFLSIAVQYGDTLRSQQLGADIADINSQIADKSNDLGKAQTDLKKPFEATTSATDLQRKSLGDLYGAYQDAVVEYSRAGLSQDDLKKKVDQLRGEFVRQATQAGYSKRDIDKYSTAFGDLKVAIEGVPKKVTVAANVDPARQALQDYLDKVAASKANVQVGSTGNGYADGYNYGNGWVQGASAARRLVTTQDKSVPGGKTYQYYDNHGRPSGGRFFAKGGFVPGGVGGFPVGGYVPGSRPADRRVDNSAGVMSGGGVVGLQGGEPIMTNAARSKYGDAMFDAINALRFQPTMMTPTIVMPDTGSGYTELSPTDRALLMEIAARAGVTIGATALERANGAAAQASYQRRTG